MNPPEDAVERGAAALDMLFADIGPEQVRALLAVLNSDFHERMELLRPLAEACLVASGAYDER